MKLTNLSLLALSASLLNARFIELHETDQVVLDANPSDSELFLVELAPGETQWITEEEKWELRRVCRQDPEHKAC
jgi:bacterial leucyl aminopeptidase